MPLASITCAEANASTLGNNQSKEITDRGEKELRFVSAGWKLSEIQRVHEGNSVVASSSISTFRAVPGLPAALPRHSFFSGLSVLPCSCTPCPARAASWSTISIGSHPSSPALLLHHLLMQNSLPNALKSSPQMWFCRQLLLCPYAHCHSGLLRIKLPTSPFLIPYVYSKITHKTKELPSEQFLLVADEKDFP